MWIEIKLSVKSPFKDSDEINEWQGIYNSDLIGYIAPTYYAEGSSIEFHCNGHLARFYPFTEELTKAIYNGFLLALQGQEVKFDEIGFIRPLLNERREELHKYMLYLQTINDLTSDVG